MLDEKLRAELDQAIAGMKEMMPPLWRQLFESCQEVGFDKGQALELVKAYILAQNPWGIRP